MEENNMSDDDGNNNSENLSENAKRLKKDGATNSSQQETSASCSNNIMEQESAATSSSTDSGVQDIVGPTNSNDNLDTANRNFPRSRNSRNRNYRRSRGEHEESSHESGEEEEEEDMDDSRSGDSLAIGSSDVVSVSSNPLVPESDSDSDDCDECAVLKKPMPKHNWFVVSELNQRQIGYCSKLPSADLFMRRCYGSLRSVQRLELMYKMQGHDGCVNCLNFHHDGSLLASGADDLKINIWDWKLGKSLICYKTKHRGNVFQSKFLYLNGDLHVASCARDGQVRIAQISKEEGVRDNRLLGSHRGPCHKLIVLPDQPHIVLSAGEDGIVLNHDVRGVKSHKIVTVKEDGREIALYSIHGHPLKSHEFCVCGRDEIVRIYDQRNCSTPAAIFSPFKRATSNDYMNYHVTCAVYNYNGSEILASYSDDDIYLFDTMAPLGSYLHKYHGHRNGATIKGVNFFGPKSEFVVSGSDCGNIYFWERNTEAIVQWMLGDDNGVVNCLEPHPQLPFLCTSGLDWDVKVWVPSCENDPTMPDLAKTVKRNSKSRINWNDNSETNNESQMLWMLWRHLRTNRTRVMRTLNALAYSTSNSSSSNSGSASTEEDDDDDDDLDGPPTCSTS